MSVEDSQCAAYVTGFDSNSVEIALSIVQGVVTVLSIVGSLLLILSHVILYPLRRSKSRILITHLAAASFLQAFPNFIAVFMDFRTRFRIDNTANSLNPTVGNHTSNATENLIVCTGTNQFLIKPQEFIVIYVSIRDLLVLSELFPLYFGLSVYVSIISFWCRVKTIN